MDDQDLFGVFDDAQPQQQPIKTIDQLAEEAQRAEAARLEERAKQQRLQEQLRQQSSSSSNSGSKKRPRSDDVVDLNAVDDSSSDEDDDEDESNDADQQQQQPPSRAAAAEDGEAKEPNEDDEKEIEDGTAAEQQYPVVMKSMTRDKCLHDVAVPPNYDGPDPMETINEPSDRPPAKQYPFTLDAFQSESVKCLEKNQSVLVSAHTSAGKTAIAEYAIAMSLRDGARVVYTSPIKALSNQKFRELTEEFKDVGLMTGDVTINPNASCLVMTTEILRSMLYRGSEVLNEVAWVIFDEVHYMRDKERGVVWEETMILLPNTVRYVFLSATIPNAVEFAGWIAKLKGQPVHVVYTDYRPTPLQHYVFPSGGDGIFLVVDEKGRFREDNYQKSIDVLQNQSAKAKSERSKGGKSGGPPQRKKAKGREAAKGDIYKLVKMIMQRNFHPVIVFSFSRKDCEEYALQLSKLDLNPNEQDKELVAEVFNNAIDQLSEDDRKLPQVQHMLPLLKKGIGIHHSGLLPIMKEVIEILFQEGLIKALFSTETFSMGLNMPARTVVFTQLKKYDGQDFRLISSGEYIQMSGRAGRRGIDDRGIVILMLNEELAGVGANASGAAGASTSTVSDSSMVLDVKAAKQMMSGKADPLNSSFHLSYYMILNLLRVEEITPEYIMERSFFQYQSEKKRPELESQLQVLQREVETLPALAETTQEETQLVAYFQLREEIQTLRNELRTEITKPIYSLNFLQPGRLVRVRDGESDWGWGPIVNFQKSAKVTENNIRLLKASDYIVDVMLKCQPLSKEQQANRQGKPKPAVDGQPCDMVILPVQLDLVDAFSSVRLYLNPNLHQQSAKDAMKMRINETLKRFPQGIPLLDPVEDMKINSKALKSVVKKVESLELRLFANPFHKSTQLGELYKQYQLKKNLEQRADEMKHKVRQAGQIVLKDDLKKMMRVLRRLGCTDQDNVIQAKGKVACELSTAEELLLTELMLNGVFNELEPEQCVALMSCMCHDDSGYSKIKENFRLPEQLAPCYKVLQEAAKRVAQVTAESKIEIDIEKYVDSFAPTLMEVTYAWCKGAKFIEICKMTDQFEGSIIRTMRRLEELLRQLCAASKSVGDDVLEQKFLKGIELLKRDIVFSSSLYIS